jgi:WD40 repeat protein
MVQMAEIAPLVRKHGSLLEVGAEPTAIVWLGNTAALALGDGRVRWIRDHGEEIEVQVHSGAILSACLHPDSDSIVTGGDDGRVCRVLSDGRVQDLGRFRNKWIEHLVASPSSGLVAAGAGREAAIWLSGADEPPHRFEFGSTIGGLALDGKGKRLAISHYNGATMLYGANPQSGRLALLWAGSHLACTLSPDGRYLLTALQETGLHGWRIPEMSDLRMGGYAAKTGSFAWDRRGRWLATSGDAAASLWPFTGKNGPIGQPPLLLARREGTIVSRVAFHPTDDVLAVGYQDGTVMLARLSDDEVLLIDTGTSPVIALCWNAEGTRLGWAREGGRIGLLDMESQA